MGVPALFRWLSQKYPKIISPVIEEKPREIEGQQIPVDHRGTNPNGEEFDNLYLDMNGIVHPCSHPDDKPAPTTEAEMMLEIFKYTDRVVNMVRPRKLLMIAVDGCAPRAKMNQQRSRRFRSAQDAKQKDEENKEFLKMLKQQNGGVLSEEVTAKLQKKTWDSNSITPGTPFMDILAASLRYWCAYKLNTDPLWENMKVIISDATVPGEGEHKIMEFVRSQRNSPEHDPNTRHVMYGLDADLIMLGLATHEPHFRILREDVFFQESKARTCKICGQTGHKAEECKGEAKQKQGEFDEKAAIPAEKPFIWLHVSILREYLAVEMNPPGFPVKFDLERAIDDWVFMCFFVGNDFLPHLPSLDIREGGIDTLIAIWREQVPLMGGWVTKDGIVEMSRAQVIMEGLAKQEDNIFRKRKAIEEKREAAAKRREREEQQAKRRKNERFNQDAAAPNITDFNFEMIELDSQRRKKHNLPTSQGNSGSSNGELTHDMIVNRGQTSPQDNANANKSAAAVMKERLKAGGVPQALSAADANSETGTAGAIKRKASALDDDGDAGTPGRDSPPASGPKKAEPLEQEDTVKLWEEGYAGRYYEQKFHVAPEDVAFRHQVAREYVTGLQWVLLYYFQGCPSWNWFYPHHYAPFAADFVELSDLKVTFDKGKPFRPYEQLMGVMPAASNHTLPEVFRGLMTDEDSDIKDFYPEDFDVDLNGKKFAWQGIAVLPFIDEKRLLTAMATKYPLLTDDEKRRNEPGHETLLFSGDHQLNQTVMQTFYSKKAGAPKFNLDPRISDGLAGLVEKDEDYLPSDTLPFPGQDGSMPDLDDNRVMMVHYQLPPHNSSHKSMLLRGVKFNPPALNEQDKAATRAAASTTGNSFGNTPLGRGPRNNGHNGHNGYGGHGGHNGRGGPRGYDNHGRHGGPPPQRSNGPPPMPFPMPLPVPGANGAGFIPPPPQYFAQNGMAPPPFPFPIPGMPMPPGGFGGQPPPPPGWNQGNNYGRRGSHHGRR